MLIFRGAQKRENPCFPPPQWRHLSTVPKTLFYFSLNNLNSLFRLRFRRPAEGVWSYCLLFNEEKKLVVIYLCEGKQLLRLMNLTSCVPSIGARRSNLKKLTTSLGTRHYLLLDRGNSVHRSAHRAVISYWPHADAPHQGVALRDQLSLKEWLGNFLITSVCLIC